jgi:ABC-type sugar transport system ATPase subunit
MSKGMLIDRKKIISYTQKFIQLFSIAIPSVSQRPKNLSGGNQQKLMLSICLGTEPKLLIVNEPTRGIDVGAKGEIHKFLLKSSAEGVGIIVFSSELPEMMSLCDRIYVLKNKSIAGCVCGEEITEESIMALAAGGVEREDQQ